MSSSFYARLRAERAAAIVKSWYWQRRIERFTYLQRVDKLILDPHPWDKMANRRRRAHLPGVLAPQRATVARR